MRAAVAAACCAACAAAGCGGPGVAEISGRRAQLDSAIRKRIPTQIENSSHGAITEAVVRSVHCVHPSGNDYTCPTRLAYTIGGQRRSDVFDIHATCAASGCRVRAATVRH